MEKETANLANKKDIIEKKSMQILRFLNLSVKNSNIVDQLGIILRLYKYVIQNVYSEETDIKNVSESKEEEYLNTLYKGITRNPGLQTTDAILFKHLLYMKGFSSHILLSKSRNGINNVSNLVKIGKEWYFFDSSLERSIYTEQGEVLYCCAALGKEEYYKFNTPIGVLPENLKKTILPLPTTVADESMPRTLIDGVVKNIPDLIVKGNPEFDKYFEDFNRLFMPQVSRKTKSDKEERE